MKNFNIYFRLARRVILPTLILILLVGCKSNQILKERHKDIQHYELGLLDVSGDGEWIIEDRQISCSSGQGFIFTTGHFNQFQLGVEFLPDAQVNSGIFIGCKGQEINPNSCFEINIWDNHPNQDYRTGSIVTKQKPIEIVNTVDHWSSMEIIAENGWIQVWVNGIKTADLEIGSHTSSPIYFQKFGEGSIKFRNIKITSLAK